MDWRTRAMRPSPVDRSPNLLQRASWSLLPTRRDDGGLRKEERAFGMDPAELAALRKLAEREYWYVDQLPAYFDVDLCLCLDDAGLILARHVTMSNVGSSLPREPIPQLWYSPVKVPGTGTTWQRILAGRTRDEFSYPSQVRVSARGHAGLARQRRSGAGQGVHPIAARSRSSLHAFHWSGSKRLSSPGAP